MLMMTLMMIAKSWLYATGVIVYLDFVLLKGCEENITTTIMLL